LPDTALCRLLAEFFTWATDLFVLFIPLIGVLFYLIFRGGTMNKRSVW